MKQQILHIWTMLKDYHNISSHELNELGILLYEQGYFVEAQVCWQRAYLLNTWNTDILYNIQKQPRNIFGDTVAYLVCYLESLSCILYHQTKKRKTTRKCNYNYRVCICRWLV